MNTMLEPMVSTIWDILGEEHEFTDFSINSLMYELHHGVENARSSKYLINALDLHGDRELRSLIEKARAEGCLIINQQNGKGYYLPADIDDLKQQYRQDTNRAMSILTRRKPVRDALKLMGETVGR